MKPLAAELLGTKVMTLLGYNGAAADEFDSAQEPACRCH
jgi:hypothetical protein